MPLNSLLNRPLIRKTLATALLTVTLALSGVAYGREIVEWSDSINLPAIVGMQGGWEQQCIGINGEKLSSFEDLNAQLAPMIDRLSKAYGLHAEMNGQSTPFIETVVAIELGSESYRNSRLFGFTGPCTVQELKKDTVKVLAEIGGREWSLGYFNQKSLAVTPAVIQEILAVNPELGLRLLNSYDPEQQKIPQNELNNIIGSSYEAGLHVVAATLKLSLPYVEARLAAWTEAEGERPAPAALAYWIYNLGLGNVLPEYQTEAMKTENQPSIYQRLRKVYIQQQSQETKQPLIEIVVGEKNRCKVDCVSY